MLMLQRNVGQDPDPIYTTANPEKLLWIQSDDFLDLHPCNQEENYTLQS